MVTLKKPVTRKGRVLPVCKSVIHTGLIIIIQYHCHHLNQNIRCHCCVSIMFSDKPFQAIFIQTITLPVVTFQFLPDVLHHLCPAVASYFLETLPGQLLHLQKVEWPRDQKYPKLHTFAIVYSGHWVKRRYFCHQVSRLRSSLLWLY